MVLIVRLLAQLVQQDQLVQQALLVLMVLIVRLLAQLVQQDQLALQVLLVIQDQRVLQVQLVQLVSLTQIHFLQLHLQVMAH
jgi:hypothetical protein